MVLLSIVQHYSTTSEEVLARSMNTVVFMGLEDGWLLLKNDVSREFQILVLRKSLIAG